jgi:hypothetical protein
MTGQDLQGLYFLRKLVVIVGGSESPGLNMVFGWSQAFASMWLCGSAVQIDENFSTKMTDA